MPFVTTNRAQAQAIRDKSSPVSSVVYEKNLANQTVRWALESNSGWFLFVVQGLYSETNFLIDFPNATSVTSISTT